jgi:hypothetical protein
MPAKKSLIPRFKFAREQYAYDSAVGSSMAGSEKDLAKAIEALAKEFAQNIIFTVVFPKDLEFLVYHNYGTGLHAGEGLYPIPNKSGKVLRWPDPQMLYPDLHAINTETNEEYGKPYRMGHAMARQVMHPGVPATRWLTNIMENLRKVVATQAFRFIMKNYSGRIPTRRDVDAFFRKSVIPSVVDMMAESIEQALPGKSWLARMGEDVDWKEGTKLDGRTPAEYFRERVQFKFR